MAKQVSAPEQVEPTAAAPRRVQKKAQPTVPDLVVEMDDWFTQLKRAVAGYNSLHQSLLSFQGQIPEGDRKKGLPVFKFPASVDGRTTIEVVADLKHVDPAYVPHVMVPLINAQGSHMMEALDEIAERVGMLQELVGSMFASQEQQAGDDAA